VKEEVQVSPSVYTFLRFTASLGSVTDTLYYNYDSAYAMSFRLDVD